jgi:hypothetical protein
MGTSPASKSPFMPFLTENEALVPSRANADIEDAGLLLFRGRLLAMSLAPFLPGPWEARPGINARAGQNELHRRKDRAPGGP